MSPLIPFFAGEKPDSCGRYIDDILQQGDIWLECTHNYIQWLFPNIEKSGVYPQAPTITPEVIAAFDDNPFLAEQLQKALVRMLAFYGLCIKDKNIITADNWNERKIQWFTRRNHNTLRITRILSCLMTLRKSDEAIQLYDTLIKMVTTDSTCNIDQQSLRYWHDAVSV